MKSTRYCQDSGLLVPSADRLPEDPCEFSPLHGFVVGCNRLRCSRCDDWVSHLVVGASRLYKCSCSSFECSRQVEIDNDHDSPGDPNVPWSCAGHPVPTLPRTLGQLEIKDPVNWADLVEKVLLGNRPINLGFTDGHDEGPAKWLVWLGYYFAGSHHADRLSEAVAARFPEGDALTRGRVLYFFERCPGLPGVGAMLDAARAQPNKVAIGYPITEYWTPPTLWRVVVSRLIQSKGDWRALEAARAALLVPLTSLPHDDLGPVDLFRQRQDWMVASGFDLNDPTNRKNLDDYGAMLKRQRVDVVSASLDESPGAFDDVEFHTWLADHIVAVAEAAPGRWFRAMNVLIRPFKKPQLGHLIVVAGVRLLEGRVVPASDFRRWIDAARERYAWVDDGWVLPLKTACDEQEKKPPVN